MSFLSSLFGSKGANLDKYREIVLKVGQREAPLLALSKEEILGKTEELKERLNKGESLESILPDAFALVREASRRVSGERHYDVQLIGGAVLHEGNIAEMRTGEGKTLVATLPAYLNSLEGKGVHVVTVNDYLARRDAAWMGQVYKLLGVSVSVINHDSSFIYDESHISKDSDKERDETGSFKVQYEFLRPISRKEAYLADITYGTNSEFGFDYLRDNIQYSLDRVVQREHHFAIVDEVDSILIDEARTPLIISAPVAESESLYATFTRVAANLIEGEDYVVDEKLRAIELKDSGIEKAEKSLGLENIYTEKGIKYVHHLETAVRARSVFKKEKDYVVKDGEVIIVDQSTGRMQPGRRWSEGLHQAIEAKEGVKVQKESRTFASVTYQNYFKMYKKLSGMTGTAMTSQEEFQKVYNLDTIEIPTNKSVARVDKPDLIFQNEIGKFKAIARKIKEINETGQPVLVGTASIDKNELLSQFLQREGINHTVLNAKNHEKEGEILAQAGKRGAVTVATNMAGRGVDIKLGGNPSTAEDKEEIIKVGGLFVLGTERHEARRIDNQLRGRSGRQGDVGESQFYVSMEDALMRIFASDSVKKLMGTFGMAEDEPIESKMISRSIEQAQKKVEGLHFDSRKHVLDYDNVLNFQRGVIYGRRREVLFGDDSVVLDELDRLVLGDEKLEQIVKEKKEQLGESLVTNVRQLILQVIDMFWVEHLEQMDYLRGSVRLRAYGQRDPLVEYKREGLQLFKELEANIDEEVRHLLPNLGGIARAETEKNLKEVHEAAKSLTASTNNINVSVSRAVSDQPKIGRNEMVEIEKDGKTQTLKYKKAEELIEKEGWRILDKK